MAEAMNRRKYHVTYDRDESGWWQARVTEVRGCHTQGRTIDEARRRIREALALFVGNADRATLVDDLELPAAAKRAISDYATLRVQAKETTWRASVAARKAVRVLRSGKLRMSTRDTARLLGVSFQRVNQLAHEPPAHLRQRRRVAEPRRLRGKAK